MKQPSFTNNFVSIYVMLEDHATFESASIRIRDTILNNILNEKDAALDPKVFLHPMERWHLYSEWKNGVEAGGFIEIVWLFGIVGAFVLLLACINFMNLSTARSEKRAKEVGVRKAIGSQKTQLVSQFFTESLLVVVIAFLLSFVLLSLSMGWFNQLSGKQISIPLYNIYFWFTCGAFVLITGIVAGSYPAIYLSSFSAMKALKGSLHAGRFASAPRKVLVVVQFTVSVTLIIATIVVYQQIQFAKDRPVGYTRNGLLMVQMTSFDFQGKCDLFRAELKNTGVVTEMSESSSPPTEIWTMNGGFDWKGRDPEFVPIFATLTVTPEYGKTVGWQFINGRDFTRTLASDSAGFVINEAAAKLLGFENAVGETVHWESWRSRFKDFRILGVIKDVVMGSPYEPATPSVFFLSGGAHHWINIQIDPQAGAANALPKIEAVFKKIVPSAPFDYKFADQEYALKFASEERIGKLASVFAALAIIISCLGLFGLSSFIAEQRTKEIGIRKVVGATVFALWKMLSKDFVVLVILSCMIAIPVAYYFLSLWLQKYEYRTTLSWWIFATTSSGALLITVLTVSYQALKAARMNPVKSLRSE
jgi:hypothetical protein